MMSNIQLVASTNNLFEAAFMGKQPPKLYPANWIKEIREKKGMSLEDVAQACGVSNPYISMLEMRKRGLSVAMAKKLAKAFDCQVSEITDGPGQMMAADEYEREVLEVLRSMDNEGAKQMFLAGLKASKGVTMRDSIQADAQQPKEKKKS